MSSLGELFPATPREQTPLYQIPANDDYANLGLTEDTSVQRFEDLLKKELDQEKSNTLDAADSRTDQRTEKSSDSATQEGVRNNTEEQSKQEVHDARPAQDSQTESLKDDPKKKVQTAIADGDKVEKKILQKSSHVREVSALSLEQEMSTQQLEISSKQTVSFEGGSAMNGQVQKEAGEAVRISLDNANDIKTGVDRLDSKDLETLKPEEKSEGKELEKGMDAPKHHSLQKGLEFDARRQESGNDFSQSSQEKAPYFFEQDGEIQGEKSIHVVLPKLEMMQASRGPSMQSLTTLTQLRSLFQGELGNAIVRSANIQLAELKRGDIKLVLHPKELGQVHIALAMEEKRVVGKIWVDNSDVKKIIEDQISSLEHSFTDVGIDVQSLEVYIRDDQQQRDNFEQLFAYTGTTNGYLGSETAQDVYEVDILGSELVNIFV